MQIYWDLKSVKRYENSILTVGTFDGIHLGHQLILQELKKRAVKREAQTTLVTFNPHPQLVLKTPHKPALQILTTITEKIDILQNVRMDRVIVIEFTKEFSNTKSYDFVKNVLFDKIGFCEIVIGHDHAFGKNREGDIQTFRTLGAELGFTVDELPAFDIDGRVVSSTAIRNMIQAGHIKQANRALGRNYFFSGKVVRGEGRGKSLNYPTANITATSKDKLIPADGVYAVYLHLRNDTFKGMMNIGMRPTFNAAERTLEVNIFDFNEVIYGENVKVEFVDKIRDEIHFLNPDELVKQLDKDMEKSLCLL
ncbi:MAG: bifunctional riboflavin kinase/FAD synthetase [bacterium]